MGQPAKLARFESTFGWVKMVCGLKIPTRPALFLADGLAHRAPRTFQLPFLAVATDKQQSYPNNFACIMTTHFNYSQQNERDTFSHHSSNVVWTISINWRLIPINQQSSDPLICICLLCLSSAWPSLLYIFTSSCYDAVKSILSWTLECLLSYSARSCYSSSCKLQSDCSAIWSELQVFLSWISQISDSTKLNSIDLFNIVSI